LDALGRLIKRAVELSQYGIDFDAQRAIKGQALENFITENTNTIPASTPSDDSWNLYVDGSSTKDDCEAGLIVETPQGEKM